MRSAVVAVVCGLSGLVASTALAQTGSSGTTAATSEAGPADLCRELLAYADMKAERGPKAQTRQAPAPAAAPLPRGDEQASGTQGGGSVGPSTSADTSSQAAAPPTTPVAPGAAPVPATSPHATDASQRGAGASPEGAPGSDAEFKLAGGMTLQQVRDTASGGDRQACRETAQKMRRAGADMPAALIALAAYEPDPAKRQ